MTTKRLKYGIRETADAAARSVDEEADLWGSLSCLGLLDLEPTELKTGEGNLWKGKRILMNEANA